MGYTYGARSIWRQRPYALDELRDAIDRKLTASQIAAELSVKFGVTITRNAVIGKANREGLSIGGAPSLLRKPRKKISDKPKRRVANVETTVAQHQAPTAEISIPVSRRISLFELTATSCRWPIGDPRSDDFCFCGADRVKPEDESNAYCAAHAKIAYTPRPTRTITPEHRRAMLAGKISRHIHAVG